MARPSLGLSRVNFHIDPSVLVGLKWLASSRCTSYSELLRQAAKEFVVREIKNEQDSIEQLAIPQEVASA